MGGGLIDTDQPPWASQSGGRDSDQPDFIMWLSQPPVAWLPLLSSLWSNAKRGMDSGPSHARCVA
eukprot:3918109-Pyramimonas_sp.AAC.1